MLRFDRLIQDGSLGITASERTRWQQGKIIPPQVLQVYWDEGLPFITEAPYTAMAEAMLLEMDTPGSILFVLSTIQHHYHPRVKP